MEEECETLNEDEFKGKFQRGVLIDCYGLNCVPVLKPHHQCFNTGDKISGDN